MTTYTRLLLLAEVLHAKERVERVLPIFRLIKINAYAVTLLYLWQSLFTLGATLLFFLHLLLLALVSLHLRS